jgi:hypothetical protein
VRLPAKRTAASIAGGRRLLMPGRAVSLPLEPGDGGAVACHQATRGKRQSQRSRPDWINCRAGSAQVPGWLVGRLGLGSGMPAPSDQLPSP